MQKSRARRNVSHLFCVSRVSRMWILTSYKLVIFCTQYASNRSKIVTSSIYANKAKYVLFLCNLTTGNLSLVDHLPSKSSSHAVFLEPCTLLLGITGPRGNIPFCNTKYSMRWYRQSQKFFLILFSFLLLCSKFSPGFICE